MRRAGKVRSIRRECGLEGFLFSVKVPQVFYRYSISCCENLCRMSGVCCWS